MIHRDTNDASEFGVRRRGFLTLLGGATVGAAVGVAGCLDGETRTAYRDWVPGNFDPVVMYMKVDSMHGHGLLPDNGDGEYGLAFEDVDEVIDLERATVLVLDGDASPEIDGEEVSEYNGFTVHEDGTRGGGFVATDGDSVVEAQERHDIRLVVDARTEEVPRLHEEVPEFRAVTTRAGEGDLALVRSHETGDGGIEASVANLDSETSDVRIAVTGDEDDFIEIEDEIRTREYLTVDESRPGVESEGNTDVLVLEATAETESVPEAFGLVAEASGRQEVEDVERVDEGHERDDEGGRERDGTSGGGNME